MAEQRVLGVTVCQRQEEERLAPLKVHPGHMPLWAATVKVGFRGKLWPSFPAPRPSYGQPPVLTETADQILSPVTTGRGKIRDGLRLERALTLGVSQHTSAQPFGFRGLCWMRDTLGTHIKLTMNKV